MKVDFHRRYRTDYELESIKKALENEDLGGSVKTLSFLDTIFKDYYGIQRLLWTGSATSSLEMAFLLLGLKAGDQIILPSFTFPSAANAALRGGADLVFCDIENQTQNLDLDKVEEVISEKTRAIVTSQYGGIPCDMDRLADICHVKGLEIIEDSAQGVHSKYKDKWLGTMGAFGVYSFHYTKNFSSGEGGALIVGDERKYLEAEILMENGTDKRAFLRGERGSYSWQQVGSNYAMGGLQGSLLLPQIKEAEKIVAKRSYVSDRYNKAFRDARIEDKGYNLMFVPDEVQSNHHIYYILCPSMEKRDSLINRMKLREIDCRSHFIPLHMSSYGRKLGYKGDDFPVSKASSERILRLPIHTEMDERMVEYVIEALTLEINNGQ